MRILRRIRFPLAALMLLTAAIAATCAAWLRWDAWYIARTLPLGYHDCRVAVAPSGNLLACLEGANPNRLSVYRLDSGERIRETSVDDLGIQYLTYGDDGRLLGFNWHRLVRFDPLSGVSEDILRTSFGPPEEERIVAVSPDARRVLLAVTERVARRGGGSRRPPTATVTYRIRDVRSREVLWELPTLDRHGARGAFSADGRRLALRIGPETQVWDYARNELLHRLSVDYVEAWAPVLFDDGRRIFAQSSIWDLETGRKLARFRFGTGHAARVNDSFLVAADGGNVRYWRQRRWEGQWSPLNFPEPWLAAGFGLLSLGAVLRHSWKRRGPSRHEAPPTAASAGSDRAT